MNLIKVIILPYYMLRFFWINFHNGRKRTLKNLPTALRDNWRDANLKFSFTRWGRYDQE